MRCYIQVFDLMENMKKSGMRKWLFYQLKILIHSFLHKNEEFGKLYTWYVLLSYKIFSLTIFHAKSGIRCVIWIFSTSKILQSYLSFSLYPTERSGHIVIRIGNKSMVSIISLSLCTFFIGQNRDGVNVQHNIKMLILLL